MQLAKDAWLAITTHVHNAANASSAPNNTVKLHEVAVLLLILLPFVLVPTFVLWAVCLRFKKKPSEIQHHCHALQVLSTVFTPTSDAWPSSLSSHFKSARLKTSRCIEIDLVELIEQMLTGRLELRDPNDLQYLFRGQLLVYGWSIKVHLDACWWMKTMIWIADQHITLSRPTLQETISVSRLMKLAPEPQIPFLDLDFVHYLDLKSEIRRIQHIRPPGSSIIVEFSCLASQIGFLTHHFILCAVPFIPDVVGHKHRNRRSNRTSAPLFSNVPYIISLLSAGPSMVKSLANISYEQAVSLQMSEKELVDNKAVRQKYIQDVGIIGWHEERLMMLWEAGLLVSGLLTRWRVTLS